MIHKSPFKIAMRNGRPHILAPRWLDPLQSWTPMGAPRFHRPHFDETSGDDTYTHPSGPGLATDQARPWWSDESDSTDSPHSGTSAGSPPPEDLWAGLPNSESSTNADPAADDLWDDVPKHTDPYAFDPETDDLWATPLQPSEPKAN
jgi:hypothetical protein